MRRRHDDRCSQAIGAAFEEILTYLRQNNNKLSIFRQ